MKIAGYQMEAVGSPLVLATREEPAPGPGHAVVEVVGCGVCHTDLGYLYDGVPMRHSLPLVLGHEVAGVVVEEGPGVTGLLGRMVVVPAVIPCGRCDICRKGRGDICPKQVFPGNDIHGGFASHLVVPAHGLCPVPEGATDRAGLPRLSVLADAVSTAYAAVRKADVRSGDFVAVVGAGGVGGFAVQVAHALGGRVLAIDVDAGRLGKMAGHGAEWTLNAREFPGKELRKKVRDLVKNAGLGPAEWKIFEASGTAAGQESAYGLLTFGATLMVVGYHPGDVTLRLSNLMAFAARAEGVWGCLPEHYPAVLDLVLSGRVALDPFIEFHPMSRIQTIFEKLHHRELSLRPVLLPDF